MRVTRGYCLIWGCHGSPFLWGEIKHRRKIREWDCERVEEDYLSKYWNIEISTADITVVQRKVDDILDQDDTGKGRGKL